MNTESHRRPSKHAKDPSCIVPEHHITLRAGRDCEVDPRAIDPHVVLSIKPLWAFQSIDRQGCTRYAAAFGLDGFCLNPETPRLLGLFTRTVVPRHDLFRLSGISGLKPSNGQWALTGGTQSSLPLLHNRIATCTSHFLWECAGKCRRSPLLCQAL